VPPTQGTLVLADISGYTSYMAGVEHEHSFEILGELIEAIANSFDGRLNIDQLEGDALCATTERTDPEIVAWLHETFGIFHNRLRDIRELSTCPCRACASAGDLGLKFIVHRGEFSRQKIGHATQLYGTDVNLVHRLAKNTVPLREYVFATRQTLEGWPANARADFVSAPQTYDVGTVDAAYADLASVKEKALSDRIVEVTPDRSKLTLHYRFAAPPEQVWKILMDPNARKRILGVPRVDMVPGAKGTLLGAEFHCRHGKDLEGKTVFRVTGCEVPEFVTMYMEFPMVGHAYRTDRLRADGDGTMNDCYTTWESEGPLGAVKDKAVALMAKKYFDAGAKAVQEMVAEGIGAEGVTAS
jgi:class 3 adenylate cyclase